MIRTILTDEDPRLRTESEPVQSNDPAIEQDIVDLADTLADFRDRAGFGRAISAPQVGIMKRLIVLNLGAGPVALLNPTITQRSSEHQVVWDDCLSVPDRLVRVERSRSISLEFQNPAGQEISWDVTAADMAELLQHEVDHLDGVLMTDRAESPDSIRPIDERSQLAPDTAVAAPRVTATGIAAQLPRIDPTFTDSPQYECEPLSEALGARVLLKVETANPIRCFKGRGASLLIADHCGASAAPRPVVTSSAGNWGQAIAYACRAYGIPTTVYAAENANPTKLDRMRALGAEVVLHGADLDEAKLVAKAFAAEQGYRFVEDGQDEAVTEGHGSIGVELADDMAATGDHLDAVLVPVGNGAMIAGIGSWLKAASPATQVLGVTPTGAPAMRKAWLAPTERDLWGSDPVETIADGLAVRIPIADAVDDMVGLVDDVLEVDDETIAEAMRLLFSEAGLLTEPSGAAGIAAILDNPERFRGRHVAVIICGSNIGPDQLALLA